MGSLLVVDGSGVCRAPIMAFALEQGLAAAGSGFAGHVEARGLEAEAARTMCESAAARIGYSGDAIGYFGAYRALRLSIADIANADLVLTAERAQRSAVVRMLPGTQASVFTWKEAAVLADVALERRRGGAAPTDLVELARLLHGARGVVPLIEPAVRTGPLHWRRAPEADPLTIPSGHLAAADHGRVTKDALDIAVTLSDRIRGLLLDAPVRAISPAVRPRARRLRRSA